MDSERSLLALGCACVLAGLSGGFVIHEHPEGLLVAAWIPYAICAAFVAVGAAIVTSELQVGLPRRVLWVAAGVAVVAAVAWGIAAQFVVPAGH